MADSVIPPLPDGAVLDQPPLPPGATLDSAQPAARVNVAPLFAGLDKVTAGLPDDQRARAESYLATVPDDAKDTERAAIANTHFVTQTLNDARKAKDSNAPNLDPATVSANLDDARDAVAQGMGWTKPGDKPLDDLAFYQRTQQHFQQQKEHTKFLGDVLGQVWDAAAGGETQLRAVFNTAISKAQAEKTPGYDPKQLDADRMAVDSISTKLTDAGQHYHEAVAAITNYAKASRLDYGDPGSNQMMDVGAQRDRAVQALNTVPPEDVPLVMAMAQREATKIEAPEKGGIAKLADRFGTMIEDTLGSAMKGVDDGFQMQHGVYDPNAPQPTKAEAEAAHQKWLADSAPQRKNERLLNDFIHGPSDPDKGSSFVSELGLSMASNLPRYLAARTPVGAAVNYEAFKQDAQDHLEHDLGYTPAQAADLAPVSGAVQSILAGMQSKLLLDLPGGKSVVGWAGDSALKRLAALTGVELAGNATIAGGFMLQDPAIRAIGHALDSSMPGVNWLTKPDGTPGELTRLAKAGASPESLAQLGVMVAIGTGFGSLAHAEYAKATVHDPVMLGAIGVKQADIDAMQKMTPDQAASYLHQNWAMLGEPDKAAVKELNARTETAKTDAGISSDQTQPKARVRITPNGDGTHTYAVTSADGRSLGEHSSPEMAGKALTDGNAQHAKESDGVPNATLSDFAPGAVKDALKKGNWAILTAENPGAKPLTPEENLARMNSLKAELDEQGINYTEARGKYGNEENLILLTDVSEEQARAIGAKHGQGSVLTNRGLLHNDGTVTPATGITEHTTAPEDFFTQLHGNGSMFTVDLDFAAHEKQLADRAKLSVDSLQRAFNLTPGEAAATHALANAMGLDPERLMVMQGGGASPDALNQESAPVFFSRLQRTVEQSQQGKATGAQWKATIRNSKLGANADEMGLVGVGDLEDGKTYTKQEVLDYLRANEVQVKDVTLGGGRTGADAQAWQAHRAAYEKAIDEIDALRDQLYQGKITAQEMADRRKPLLAARDAANDAMVETDPRTVDDPTHFSQYQLPGGKEGSYREVLLTVPKEKPTPTEWAVVRSKDGRRITTHATEEEARSNLDVEGGEHIEGWRNGSLAAALPAWRDGHSQYSDIANPIVRLRLNERTTADGKRMLFLEEVQPPQEAQQEKMPALFRKNWREIAMKWAIRHAAENGFDSVGWTRGEVQDERYDLSKQVASIHYDPSTNELQVWGHDGSSIVGSETEVPPEKIADYIGKDTAKKLLETTPDSKGKYNLSGLDLKVGGEGLRKLYDVDFCNVVNGLAAVKKSGQKVGAAELEPREIGEADGKKFYSKESVSIHSLDLTPAIRDSVMQGQPLAQGVKGSAEFAEDGKAVIRGFQSADVSTGLHELAHVARRQLFDRNTPAEQRAGISDSDISAAEKWSGAADGVWSREAEEKFARGFESYLHEGKSPTKALGDVFAKIGAWMGKIYQQLTGSEIDVGLTKEMRAVFDNLVKRNSQADEPAPSPLSKPSDPKQKDAIGISNANVDTNLEKMGLPPATHGEKLKDAAVIDAAMQKMAADPHAGQKLLSELAAKNRPLDPHETGLAIVETNRLALERDNADDRLNEAVKSGDEKAIADAKVKKDAADKAYADAADVVTKAGTVNAQALRLRARLLNEDYSLAAIKRSWQAAGGGKELTEAQSAEIADLAQKYRELSKQFEQLKAQANTEAETKPAIRPVNRVLAYLDKQADAAHKRMLERATQLNAGIDPQAISDLAIIAAKHIAHGVDDAAGELVKAYGEHIKPYLKEIMDRARGIHENAVTETSEPPERKALRVQAELQAVKDRIKQGREIAAEQSATPYEKTLRNIAGAARFSALSGYHTLEKLFAFSISRIAETPLTEAAANVWSVIPGFRDTFKASTFEGGANAKTLGKFYANLATKGMAEAWQQLRTGTTKTKQLAGRSEAHPAHWYDFMGNLHAVEKTPLLTATNEMLLAKAEAKAVARGLDPRDEFVQAGIRKEAFDYAARSILQENNEFAAWWKSQMERLKAKNPKTGEASSAKQALATFIETFFTKGIIRTPANYVMQTLERTPAGLMMGLGKQFAAWRRDGGIPLSDAQATVISRLLSAGAVGSAFFVWGAIDATNNDKHRTFGGYWNPGDKRSKDDVPFGAIRVGDTTLPHLLTHNPLTESAQMGATMMRVALSKISKHDQQDKGALAGVLTAIFGLAEQAPIASQGTRLAGLGDPAKQTGIVGEAVRGLIPQLIQNIAEDTDKKDKKGEPIQRAPKTITDHVKMGVPGLRQEVKPKN